MIPPFRRLRSVATGAMPRVLNVRRLAVILGVVLIACCAALYLKARSFESWLKRMEQPGFTLLYKQETPSHFFAVFDAGESHMAICARDLHGTRTAQDAIYEVLDMNGNDLTDQLPEHSVSLNRKHDFGLFSTLEVNGMMYPVQQDYRGDVRVVIQNDSDTILDATVPWNPTDGLSP